MASSAFTEAIVRESAKYGLDLDEVTVTGFSQHFELLSVWNRKLNLTRVIHPDEAARFHFLESAMLTALVPRPTDSSGCIVDIGSGAGFPGVPLACMWDDRDFVLLEPNGKRAVFLKEVVRKIGLSRVRVVNERFDADRVRAGDMLVSRALEGLESLLESIVCCAASTVVLYSDPTILARAREFAPGRSLNDIAIPETANRRIGILTS